MDPSTVVLAVALTGLASIVVTLFIFHEGVELKLRKLAFELVVAVLLIGTLDIMTSQNSDKRPDPAWAARTGVNIGGGTVSPGVRFVETEAGMVRVPMGGYYPRGQRLNFYCEKAVESRRYCELQQPMRTYYTGVTRKEAAVIYLVYGTAGLLVFVVALWAIRRQRRTFRRT